MVTLFAQNLKAAMKKAGMRQKDLAEKTGISKVSISQYLSGKNLPGKDRMESLAKALGISVKELTYSPSPTSKKADIPIRISVREAAACMGKNPQFVREKLKRGDAPFGDASPGTGSRMQYFIRPEKFREYVGERMFTAYFGCDGGGSTDG